MRYLIIPILVLLIPTGCASLQSEGWQPSLAGASFGTYPEDYQSIVKQWYGQHLKNPDTAKFVEISTPKKDAMVIDPYLKKASYGYSVCARVKAKNKLGRYTANQKLLIREGKVVQYVSPTRIRGTTYDDPCRRKD